MRIEAQSIGKVYRQYQSPRQIIKEWLFKKPQHEEIWALKDFSLTLEKGLTFGVIGNNGAGKSTLLKLLAGTMITSTGSLKIEGRVSAILELGSGFHTEFSGLENIRLACALLGLSAAETAEKIPEIIDFSELADAIHRPVKTYSSGMFVRLAFSVVTSVDPDILIVDEALSVGDNRFQKKSMDRMLGFKEAGKMLVFCSHNLYHVKELCDQAVWLDKGQVQMMGAAHDVLDAYQDNNRGLTPPKTQKKIKKTVIAPPTDAQKQTWIKEIALNHKQEKPVYITGERFIVEAYITHQGSEPINDVHIGIIIKRNDGIQCYGASTAIENIELHLLEPSQYGISYVIEDLPLLSGEYALEIWLIDQSNVHIYDSIDTCCHFKVRQPENNRDVGVCSIPHQWTEIES